MTIEKDKLRQLIIKSDEERLVYGEVYIPLDVDSQEEAMTAEEIRKMAHAFLEKGLIEKIDVNHNKEDSGCVVVESFIARKDDPDGFIEGAWVLVTRVIPDELWEKVKSGELNGYSFHGSGQSVTLDAEVDMPVYGNGDTEESLDGPLPPHSHGLSVKFDNDGKIIACETDESLSHVHDVKKATSTDPSFGHSHRLIFE